MRKGRGTTLREGQQQKIVTKQHDTEDNQNENVGLWLEPVRSDRMGVPLYINNLGILSMAKPHPLQWEGKQQRVTTGGSIV